MDIISRYQNKKTNASINIGTADYYVNPKINGILKQPKHTFGTVQKGTKKKMSLRGPARWRRRSNLPDFIVIALQTLIMTISVFQPFWITPSDYEIFLDISKIISYYLIISRFPKENAFGTLKQLIYILSCNSTTPYFLKRLFNQLE